MANSTIGPLVLSAMMALIAAPVFAQEATASNNSASNAEQRRDGGGYRQGECRCCQRGGSRQRGCNFRRHRGK